jgi:hypothetical protein
LKHPVLSADAVLLHICLPKKSKKDTEMDCGECMIKYETDMETACPEWDKDCKMKE